ncbi:MAG: APC family permease [Alphaproteobacteria bacterium]|nr:APC family permease [Alphaproteobacteria bacterium]
MAGHSSPGGDSASEPKQLRKNSLGTAAISFLVISAAAPLTGIAGAFPIAILQGNGSGLPFDFVLITILLLIFAVGYCRMASRITHAGSFFAFVSKGLGGVAGSSAALVCLLAYNGLQIGLYGLFGAATAGTVASLTGLDLPWYLWSLAAAGLIGLMGFRRIEFSARLLTVLVVVEFLVILILDALILLHGGDRGLGLSSFSLASLGQGVPVISIVVCFSCFMGFEAATIYSEEAKHPSQTVKRATLVSILLIGGFFTLTAWLVVEGIGSANLVSLVGSLANADGSPAPETMIYALSDRYGGASLTLAISLLFVTSIFAAMQAFHNVIARYFFALGREGLLFSSLGQTHPRYQSPHLGSLLQSLLTGVTVGVFALVQIDPVLGLFNWLATLGTLGLIVVMAAVSLSIAVYFGRQREVPRKTVQTLIFPVLAAVLLLGIAGLLTANFSVLIGLAPDDPLYRHSYAMPLLIPVVGLIGLVVGLRQRGSSPIRADRGDGAGDRLR